MIRFKPLPQIALTDLQPAFYDVESQTAIEMTAKFYSYLQELVNDYNSFVTEVNNEINNFENDINHNIEEFTCCIKKLMSDYIESVDMKIELQDSKIQDAINYMKENIVETTNTIINQAIENGDIQVSISYDEPTEALSFNITREGE